jgi:hypothetical protein
MIVLIGPFGKFVWEVLWFGYLDLFGSFLGVVWRLWALFGGFFSPATDWSC